MTEREKKYLKALELFNETNRLYLIDFGVFPEITVESQQFLVALSELADTGFIDRYYESSDTVMSGYELNDKTLDLITRLTDKRLQEEHTDASLRAARVSVTTMKIQTIILIITGFIALIATVATGIQAYIGWRQFDQSDKQQLPQIQRPVNCLCPFCHNQTPTLDTSASKTNIRLLKKDE